MRRRRRTLAVPLSNDVSGPLLGMVGPDAHGDYQLTLARGGEAVRVVVSGDRLEAALGFFAARLGAEDGEEA